jgi:aryl-alcohol dehydrogenase-like predicted oxidoreductase
MNTSTTSGVRRVRLGPQLEVSALGLGCMGMAEFYGPSDEQECVATIAHAVERGVDFIDTAYMYGGGRSEQIVGKALARIGRDRVTLATKCGLIRTESGVRIDGTPEHLRAAVDESLTRLGTDRIDLLYLHRVDPDVPVEESIGAMAQCVAAGKVRLLGISEAGEDSLRRAHATHPMSALQSEFSLCTREPESTLLPVCRELGIGFVAWGPLSRGLLTGRLTATAFASDDIRSVLPRFAPAALAGNLELVDRLAALAAERGLTLAQLALAWILAQGAVPIPGAMNRGQFDENTAAAGVELDRATLAALDALAPAGAFDGDRFHAPMLATVDQ